MSASEGLPASPGTSAAAGCFELVIEAGTRGTAVTAAPVSKQVDDAMASPAEPRLRSSMNPQPRVIGRKRRSGEGIQPANVRKVWSASMLVACDRSASF